MIDKVITIDNEGNPALALSGYEIVGAFHTFPKAGTKAIAEDRHGRNYIQGIPFCKLANSLASTAGKVDGQ